MSTILLHEVSVKFPESSSTAAANVSTSRSLGLGDDKHEKEPPRAHALIDINLEIRHGETMGILGPSGCGKTTLLRAIAGLTPIDRGVIMYDDRDMAAVPPGERGIGIVFQNYALYPTMDSRENVGFFFRVHRRDAEIPERIREVSRVMGIGFSDLLDKRPAWLSGGQRQRVALARCIARDPKLFLFDEPLSNLDAKLRVQTRIELKRLISKYRVTGVYVTHDQTEALALCDRIAIMMDGQIEQVGTARFLMQHPVSTRVATFLGSPPMNLFPGELSDEGWRGHSFHIPLSLGYSRQNVTLGVSAEDFQLSRDGPLNGRVILLEPLLAERVKLAYIETEHQRIAVRLPQTDDVRRGDYVSLAVNPENIHLFDTASGRRL